MARFDFAGRIIQDEHEDPAVRAKVAGGQEHVIVPADPITAPAEAEDLDNQSGEFLVKEDVREVIDPMIAELREEFDAGNLTAIVGIAALQKVRVDLVGEPLPSDEGEPTDEDRLDHYKAEHEASERAAIDLAERVRQLETELDEAHSARANGETERGGDDEDEAEVEKGDDAPETEIGNEGVLKAGSDPADPANGGAARRRAGRAKDD